MAGTRYEGKEIGREEKRREERDREWMGGEGEEGLNCWERG